MSKLVFAHLSDLHIGRSPGYAPERIGDAIASHLDGATVLYIVVSGDIAFSGKDREYTQAQDAIEGILGPIRARVARVHLVAVPGNHDCDFACAPEENKQSAFFRFAATRLGAPPVPEPRWEGFIAEGLRRGVRFHCVNTAWNSVLDDYRRPGNLSYDVSVLPPVTGDSDLAVAVLHHPLDWLDYSSREALSAWVRDHVDLVFCGHTHKFEPHSTGSPFGASVHFIQGHALWDPDSRSSGFQIIEVEEPGFEATLTEYQGSGINYKAGPPVGLGGVRNPALAAGRWQISADFLATLLDPELVIPKPRVTLDDIFVEPVLVRKAPAEAADATQRSPQEAPALEVLREPTGRKVIITGQEGAGKTALMRILFRRLHAAGLIPVILDGGDLPAVPSSAGAPKVLKKAIANAVSLQYGERAVDCFWQLPPVQRVLLVDDLRSDLASDRLWGQVSILATAASTVVGFAPCWDPLSLALSSLISGADEIERYDIKEFGYLHRDKLIERWLLASGPVPEAGDIAQRARAVNTVICGLMPSVPRTVLMVLQLLENASNAATVGSYGHIYHSLITAALAGVEGSQSEGAVDIYNTYLTRLAVAVRRNGGGPIGQEAVDCATRNYETVYGVSLVASKAIRELRTVGILARGQDGVSFRYPYAYYYFLASYCKDAIGGRDTGVGTEEAEEAEGLLSEMTEAPWKPENGVTLAFFVYFTKDRGVINRILSRARVLLNGVTPCALGPEDDAGFFSSIVSSDPPIVLSGVSPEENRREHLASLDRQGEEGGLPQGELGRAMATIAVLGRILKNFPGSLQRDIKADIVEECFALSMRCARAALGHMRLNADEIRGLLEAFVRRHRPEATEAEVAEGAGSALIAFARLVCVAFVRAAADAAGMPGLEMTYRDIRARGGLGNAGRIIDTAVRLENSLPINIQEIRDVNDALRDCRLARLALRDVVAIFLYLFRCERIFRQQLESTMNILSSPRMIANPDKRTAV